MSSSSPQSLEQVYGVRCPLTGLIVYVGETVHSLREKRRRAFNRTQDISRTRPFIRWLRVMQAAGLRGEVQYELLNFAIEGEAIRHFGLENLLNVIETETLGASREWTQRELDMVGRHPDNDVAVRLGCSIETVRLARKRLGRPSAKRRRKIKRLDREAVRHIRENYQGRNRIRFAEQHGVSPWAISAAAYGKTWKDVDPPPLDPDDFR